VREKEGEGKGTNKTEKVAKVEIKNIFF